MTPVQLAVRRLARRPLGTLVLLLSVAVTTFVLSSSMLLGKSIESTSGMTIDAGPNLVVARVSAGGHAAIPVAAASQVGVLVGVKSATPRVWGILGGQTNVTVIGDPTLTGTNARAGSRVPRTVPTSVLYVQGYSGKKYKFTVQEELGADKAPWTADVLYVPEASARVLLDVPADMATDISVETLRSEEDTPLVGEIARTLGYPVRVSTRAEMKRSYLAQTSLRTGMTALVLAPSVLSLLLIVLYLATSSSEMRSDMGTLRLLGWTTPQLWMTYIVEKGLVVLTSTLLGFSLAYAGLFLFGGGPWVALVFGWQSIAPGVALLPQEVFGVLYLVLALVALPALGAATVPVLRTARVDPIELLEQP